MNEIELAQLGGGYRYPSSPCTLDDLELHSEALTETIWSFDEQTGEQLTPGEVVWTSDRSKDWYFCTNCHDVFTTIVGAKQHLEAQDEEQL